MDIRSILNRKSLVRVSIILLISLLLGFIYNQIHPNGLHWRFLFSNALAENLSQELTYTVISADSALKFMGGDDVILIDTREAEDFDFDHIEGALNIPTELFYTSSDIIQLPTEKSFILLYDEAGEIDKLVLLASVINTRHIKHFYILYGGYLSWLNKGYPLQQGSTGE